MEEQIPTNKTGKKLWRVHTRQSDRDREADIDKAKKIDNPKKNVIEQIGELAF